MGRLWSLYATAPDDAGRARLEPGAVVLKGRGKSPADGTVLTQQVGDRAYAVTVELELVGEAEGGLLLFFDDRLFLGMGIDGKRMASYRGGKVSHWPEPAPSARRMHMRIVNDHQVVTFYYSIDGKAWTRHGVRSQVTGYNAHTIDDLLSLRPALFAAGPGEVRFKRFEYRAL
jgi:xylan 1,4-beta-xylosidase